MRGGCVGSLDSTSHATPCTEIWLHHSPDRKISGLVQLPQELFTFPRWKRLIPESGLPYWHFILWSYSCICIYNLDRNMRITTAPSFLHAAQGRSVSLGGCNVTKIKKQKEILQSTAAINIIYFLTSLTVWVACMICIALLQFTSLRQHCDCGRAMRIFSCGGLFRGSLFCWGGLSSSWDEQIQAEWKVQLESRPWKIAQKTKHKNSHG